MWGVYGVCGEVQKTHNEGRRKKETGNPGGVDFIYQVKTGDIVVPI